MGELGKKMVRYMELRNFSPKTKQAYIHQIKGLIKFYNKPPQGLGREELEKYLHHMRYEKKLSWSNVNIAYSAFVFFYETVLGQPKAINKIPRPKGEKKLPSILSREEVAAIFKSIPNLKQRLFFMTIYSCGLRISEACQLKLLDIDSKRMQIRIEQGKGNKDRYTILSPKLLDELRCYYRAYRPSYWLFPSSRLTQQHIGNSSMQRVFSRAKKKWALTGPRRYIPCAIALPPTC